MISCNTSHVISLQECTDAQSCRLSADFSSLNADLFGFVAEKRKPEFSLESAADVSTCDHIEYEQDNSNYEQRMDQTAAYVCNKPEYPEKHQQ